MANSGKSGGVDGGRGPDSQQIALEQQRTNFYNALADTTRGLGGKPGQGMTLPDTIITVGGQKITFRVTNGICTAYEATNEGRESGVDLITGDGFLNTNGSEIEVFLQERLEAIKANFPQVSQNTTLDWRPSGKIREVQFLIRESDPAGPFAGLPPFPPAPRPDVSTAVDRVLSAPPAASSAAQPVQAEWKDGLPEPSVFLPRSIKEGGINIATNGRVTGSPVEGKNKFETAARMAMREMRKTGDHRVLEPDPDRAGYLRVKEGTEDFRIISQQILNDADSGVRYCIRPDGLMQVEGDDRLLTDDEKKWILYKINTEMIFYANYTAYLDPNDDDKFTFRERTSSDDGRVKPEKSSMESSSTPSPSSDILDEEISYRGFVFRKDGGVESGVGPVDMQEACREFNNYRISIGDWRAVEPDPNRRGHFRLAEATRDWPILRKVTLKDERYDDWEAPSYRIDPDGWVVFISAHGEELDATEEDVRTAVAIYNEKVLGNSGPVKAVAEGAFLRFKPSNSVPSAPDSAAKSSRVWWSRFTSLFGSAPQPAPSSNPGGPTAVPHTAPPGPSSAPSVGPWGPPTGPSGPSSAPPASPPSMWGRAKNFGLGIRNMGRRMNTDEHYNNLVKASAGKVLSIPAALAMPSALQTLASAVGSFTVPAFGAPLAAGLGTYFALHEGLSRFLKNSRSAPARWIRGTNSPVEDWEARERARNFESKTLELAGLTYAVSALINPAYGAGAAGLWMMNKFVRPPATKLWNENPALRTGVKATAAASAVAALALGNLPVAAGIAGTGLTLKAMAWIAETYFPEGSVQRDLFKYAVAGGVPILAARSIWCSLPAAAKTISDGGKIIAYLAKDTLWDGLGKGFVSGWQEGSGWEKPFSALWWASMGLGGGFLKGTVGDIGFKEPLSHAVGQVFDGIKEGWQSGDKWWKKPFKAGWGGIKGTASGTKTLFTKTEWTPVGQRLYSLVAGKKEGRPHCSHGVFGLVQGARNIFTNVKEAAFNTVRMGPFKDGVWQRFSEALDQEKVEGVEAIEEQVGFTQAFAEARARGSKHPRWEALMKIKGSDAGKLAAQWAEQWGFTDVQQKAIRKLVTFRSNSHGNPEDPEKKWSQYERLGEQLTDLEDAEAFIGIIEAFKLGRLKKTYPLMTDKFNIHSPGFDFDKLGLEHEAVREPLAASVRNFMGAEGSIGYKDWIQHSRRMLAKMASLRPKVNDYLDAIGARGNAQRDAIQEDGEMFVDHLEVMLNFLSEEKNFNALFPPS